MDDQNRSTKTIGVITINWNAWQSTIACLEALRSTVGPTWHLYLVDNASEDDSVSHLSDLGDDVTLIKSTVNTGWTGGNNIGIKQALAAGHKYIFILNNDAFVEPNTLAILMETFRESAARMPVLGPVHKKYGEDIYDFLGLIDDCMIRIETSQPLDKTYETWLIKGAGMFVHSEHFQVVGLFDDRFFLNWDDSDWCLRVMKAGFPLVIVRDAVIKHIGSASLGSMHSPLQSYFLARNCLLFGEKHLSIVERLKGLRFLIWQARELPRATPKGLWVFDILTAKFGSSAAFRRGIMDYCWRRFGDCPPVVRKWNKDAATRNAIHLNVRLAP
jgi:GT2 family glycosyltransferase